jgi:hypothetical protein
MEKSVVISELGNWYGKLLVIARDTVPSKSGEAKWICKCSCGNVKSIYGSSLRKGLSKSCGCSKEKDETGKRYGKLLVMERDSLDNRKWVCRCDCGKRTSVYGTSLREGSTRSCGCLTRKIHIPTGTRFSHLVVIKESKNKYKKEIQWICKCDCGKIIDVPSSFLRRGTKTKCGTDCPKFGVIEKEASFNVMLQGMIKGAKRRGQIWKLSRDDVRSLTSDDCFYCGHSPSQKPSTQTKLNGDYIYNGIDRVDNSVGYTIENCVPCCWKCNRAKGTLSYKDFMQMIEDIYYRHSFMD